MNLFQNSLPWTNEFISQFKQEDLLKLFDTASNVKQDQSLPITHAMVLIYSKTHPPLNLEKFKCRQILVDWYLSIGKKSFAIDRFHDLVNLSQDKLEVTTKEFGINIIGYARSMSGLGEDTRSMTRIIDKLGIPFCILSCRHVSDSIDYAEVQNEAFYPKYSVSVFCMNYIEFKKLTTIYQSMDIFGYIILQAPWELPELPKQLIPPENTINEFWAISNFVENVLVKAVVLNVHHIYPVVEKLNHELAFRKISQKRVFSFLYIFDASSFISRKNPIGVVIAFQNAFRNGQSVQLTLKISNPLDNSEFLALRHACNSDSRIKLMTEQFNNLELSKLYDKSDCYVSLHRSEGFGRTIAEAALHKKPIIVTGWSGSCDIFPNNYKFFVDYTLVKLKSNDYPFSEGQHWAEPDLACASKLILSVFNMDNEERQRVGLENFNFVTERFSEATALQQIKPLLASALRNRLK